MGKLTEEQVIEIFQSTYSTEQLAKKYNVSASSIRAIKRKKYHKRLLEGLGDPGLDQTSLKHGILPEHAIRKIYDFTGTPSDLYYHFKCNTQFARNIKFGRTYTRYTENYDHDPGELKLHGLSWDNICDIRGSNLSCSELSIKYNVHPETIRNIINYKTRKYE